MVKIQICNKLDPCTFISTLLSRSSSLTNNLVNTITPTPTKPVSPYRIPARRTLDKENVKPPAITRHGHKVSNGYVNFPEFAEALARCRRVQEYEKTKKGGGTKEVDLTVKNRLGPNPKRELNKELEECFAGFMFPNSPDPSTLPMPTSLIKKTMDAQLIMV
ncbi:hypothetical protein Tco_0885054 [Tanacetum coccineum]